MVNLLVGTMYEIKKSGVVINLILSCIMSKNGQAYFKTRMVFTPQDF